MNLIKPKEYKAEQSGELLSFVTEASEVEDVYSSLLYDESKLQGGPVASLCFPKSPEQVSQAVARAIETNSTISVSTSRTGLTGGAVPADNSSLISLEKYTGVSSVELDSQSARYFAKIKGGTSLKELNSYLAENPVSGAPELYFPVDPTETTASVSGMVACNAAGARSYYYGATRKWVKGLTVVFADASVLSVQRGDITAKDGEFVIETSKGTRVLSCDEIPKPETKNTLGYSFDKEIDLVDVIVGSEGTLGIICDVEFWLAEVPSDRLFLLQFLDDPVKGLRLVEALRGNQSLVCHALEYCDKRCLDLIKDCAAAKESRAIQAITSEFGSAVFAEIFLDSDEAIVEAFEELETVVSSVGANLEQSIAGSEPKDLRDIKTFRHAIPETINGIIAERKLEHPSLHKIATDMAVPDEHLEEVFHLYNRVLSEAGLDFAVFGHAGNNHFHVNILPEDGAQLDLAKQKYAEIASEVVKMNGAVSAEHGIGRIKKSFLTVQYSEEVLKSFKKIKLAFDPENRLNPGVLIDL